MPIFKVNAGKLKKLNATPLDKEKNLQQLLETVVTNTSIKETAKKLRFLAPSALRRPFTSNVKPHNYRRPHVFH